MKKNQIRQVGIPLIARFVQFLQVQFDFFMKFLTSLVDFLKKSHFKNIRFLNEFKKGLKKIFGNYSLAIFDCWTGQLTHWRQFCIRSTFGTRRRNDLDTIVRFLNIQRIQKLDSWFKWRIQSCAKSVNIFLNFSKLSINFGCISGKSIKPGKK